uniref:Putative secreted protein n=1 Tax=Anopheles darlingi TaxID=43151 RepID=A0A2M4D480_ANODA
MSLLLLFFITCVVLSSASAGANLRERRTHETPRRCYWVCSSWMRVLHLSAFSCSCLLLMLDVTCSVWAGLPTCSNSPSWPTRTWRTTTLKLYYLCTASPMASASCWR